MNRSASPHSTDVDQGCSPDSDAQDFDMRQHMVDQQSLRPIEDLVIPEAINGLRKSVSAIHAVPLKAEHNHTLHTRRLFDACILVAQLDLRKRDRLQVDRIYSERISPMFETRVSDLARLAGIPGKNYERLYQDLDRLYEMNLKWNIVGEDAAVVWDMKSHFLSSLGYGKGGKRGSIRFSMDPAVLNIILEPKHWATLSLQVMKGLSTASSYSLYQNCWRYVNTHAKVTADLPTLTWITLLVGHSSYVKTDANGRVSINYGEFKRRVLTDALARVNDVPALDYTLELKESFSGNRVSRLQFRFIPKKKVLSGLPLTWSQDGVQVLARLGFTESDVATMSQEHSYQEVAEALTRLKAADTKMRAAGKPITSKKAYFNGILNNVTSGANDDELESKRVEAQARAQEAIKNAKDREDRMKEGFARHQAEVFCKTLFELDVELRADLLAEFEESLEGSSARMLLERGWSPKNVGALSLLRTWLLARHPEIHEDLHPNPEDKDFNSWTAWRLDALSNSKSQQALS